MLKRRSIITLDKNREVVTREAQGDDKSKYFFGETVGVLVFRPWYPAINAPGHFANMESYDFPVRLAFVDDPFDAAGYMDSSMENRGWNIQNWVEAAQQLQEDGVKAIVCGCGLAGSIQSDLEQAVDIPIYSSTLLFINWMSEKIGRDKTVGILTIGKDFMSTRKLAILEECGVKKDVKIAIAGMYESNHQDQFMKYLMENGDVDSAISDVVNTAKNLIANNSDIGGFVVECTDLPPFSKAIKTATGLPVFDPVDLLRRVHEQVK